MAVLQVLQDPYLTVLEVFIYQKNSEHEAKPNSKGPGKEREREKQVNDLILQSSQPLQTGSL